VYAGLACHWTPHPRPSGDPHDPMVTAEASSLRLHRVLIPDLLTSLPGAGGTPHLRCVLLR
jgi:hypothetical protein